MLNPVNVVNSTETKIRSKTWMHFPTLNTLKTSQTQSLELPPPLQQMEQYPGASDPLIDHIAEPWNRNAQGCLGKNLQNNPYYLFATCEE
jgi:hypothetical protein